jgi:hypothetical protein
MSTTTAKKVRVQMNFGRLTYDGLATAGTAAVADLDGNPKVTNPPVSIADFKTGLQTYVTALAASQDGGKKALAERNKQFMAFSKMMRKQAMYVEELAGTDPTIVTGAGFQIMTGPVPTPDLSTPTIEKVVQKAAGQLQPVASSQPGVRMLQIHYGVAGPGGAPPASWTLLELATARPAPVITGLTELDTLEVGTRGYACLQSSLRMDKRKAGGHRPPLLSGSLGRVGWAGGW